MPTILKGAEAIKLFVQGRERWNQWVKDNPDASVDFTGIKFCKLPEQYKPLSFVEFQFPDGDVLFDRAEFGDGDVDFENAVFGNGKVSFFKSIFGSGNINFEFCQFGAGDLSFEQTQFGDGDVIFHCTDFNDGLVSFTTARFGKGDISFFGAQFGAGKIDFTGCHFDKGDLGFLYCNFGEGDFAFNEIQLTNRNVYFREAQSPVGQMQLCDTKFCSALDLSDLKNTHNISELSLSGSQFKSGLDLSGLTLKNPVNLLNTKPGTGIVLHQLECHFDTQKVAPKGLWSRFNKAKNSTITQYFSRLRDIAQLNNNAIAEQYFYKQTKLSARWHALNKPQSLVDVVIEQFCDYGRSARKPLMILLMLMMLNVSMLWLNNGKSAECQSLSNVLATGVSVSIPFAGASGLVKDDWLQQCVATAQNKNNMLFLFTISGTVSSLMFMSIFFTLYYRYKQR